MNRKRVIILAAVIAAVTFGSLLVWSFMGNPVATYYYKNISRETNNAQEEAILRAAESVNYSAITGSERFVGSSNPEAYLHPGTYLEYTYPNFVDSQVIDYYTARYDGLQGKGDPESIKFTYEANVSQRSQFRIYNSPPPEGATWRNITVVYSAPDGSLKTTTTGPNDFYYLNQTGYQRIDSDFDFNFSDCYIINMQLRYNEVYAPLAGFFVDSQQMMVLDRDQTPVLVGISTGAAVA